MRLHAAAYQCYGPRWNHCHHPRAWERKTADAAVCSSTNCMCSRIRVQLSLGIVKWRADTPQASCNIVNCRIDCTTSVDMRRGRAAPLCVVHQLVFRL
jgi:hypothetical protein